MSRRSRPLMDACLSMTGPMAERCQGFVDDMNSQEMNTGPRTRALKEKDELAREASARMLMANLCQQLKADPKVTIGMMLTKLEISK